MAISIVNQYTATQTGTGSSLTIPSVTVGSGEVLVVACTMRDGGSTVTGVTWNTSENMVEEVETVLYNQAAIYSLNNPTATTANVVVTYSASRDRPKIATAYVLSGVDTTDVVEATGSKNSAGSTALSASVTSVTNNALILGAFCQLSDATNPNITADSPQTQTINQEVQGTFGGRMGQGYFIKATAGSTSIAWTSDQSLQWEGAVVAIKPATTTAATDNALAFCSF